MSTEEKLRELRQSVAGGKIGTAALWGGAGVVVDRKPHGADSDKKVVTEYPREVSWMFKSLKEAFDDSGLVDYLSKFEFYGRLADAAITAIGGDPGISKQDLCLAMLDEADRILSEK